MKIVPSLNGDTIIYLIRTKNNKTIHRATSLADAEQWRKDQNKPKQVQPSLLTPSKATKSFTSFKKKKK